MIHCRSEEQAGELREALQERLKACGLEMHPMKTRIVYCKDEDRNKSYPYMSFDFLGYTFRSRKSKNKNGEYFTGFLPAVGDKAKKAIRERIRAWKLSGRSGSSLSGLAEEINPVLKGWINYYGHFYKSELQDVLGYLNLVLKR